MLYSGIRCENSHEESAKRDLKRGCFTLFCGIDLSIRLLRFEPRTWIA